MERLAQRSAESAQQMVGTQSAGIEKSLGATGLVGAKETGETPTWSCQSCLSSQAGDITLHLWNLILWSSFGSFEQMVTGLLRNVVAKERDPALADGVNMMERKRRLQVQLYYVIALTCRRRVSLVVRRVFSSGLEAWKQLCRVFELWVRLDVSGCSRPHCRQREQTVRCGKISGCQVSERQKTSSWQCCKSTCATESSLTNQTCSQDARRRCATLFAMRQPNSSKQSRQEQCLELWSARICRHVAEAKVSRRRSRRNASVV